MAKHYDSKFVECPFFHYYDSTKISCEGVEKNVSTHLIFRSPEERRQYMKNKCCYNHTECVIADALYYKYNNTKE